MDKLTRIAIVSEDRCKPKKCKQECKRLCPVVSMGKLCIEVDINVKVATISETLCNGCGICAKVCPYNAISIINLPTNLTKETTHRYNQNSFKLHRLPIPRPNQVLGLIGTNGIGKSTALKILAGKIVPNLGQFDRPPSQSDIIRYFRGSELQKYFTDLFNGNLTPIIKPQYVDTIPRAVKGKVKELVDVNLPNFDLSILADRNIEDLSGGELQRFACAMTFSKKANVYMFDEPSSYLDVKQRIKIANSIRSLCTADNYVIVVEHDMSVIDYMADFVCCLYGVQGAYGVVTMPYGVREGINIFLDGFIPTENLRFRDYSLSFKITENEDEPTQTTKHEYPSMVKTMGDFTLAVKEGSFSDSQVNVLLGENGTGKTTFIRMLAGLLVPDDETILIPKFNISYKPQKIAPKFEGSVRELLHNKITDAYTHPQFISDVMKPMAIPQIIDQKVSELSGGELQRVAVVLCLGKPADIYLIDEPSAYLDAEQRIICAKVIKRFILHAKKTAFVVEHDFTMATYLADQVIVFTGTPSVNTVSNNPQSLVAGMNRFLEQLDISFRHDCESHRPRINKFASTKDIEQKRSGNFFFTE